MPTAKAKPKASATAPATPRALCPFSGDPLVFAEVTTLAAGHKMPMIQVRGTGWVSTKLFDSRAEAEYFFSHDLGVAPSFPNPRKRVEVVGERRPPERARADVEETLKAASEFGEHAVKLMERK